MSAASEADLIRVVLADANVLYSRVLRDYLLYAADREVLAVTWSSTHRISARNRLTRPIGELSTVDVRARCSG